MCRQFSRGQINQLRYECNAAKTFKGDSWVTIGFHTGASSKDGSIRTIPLLFRGLLLRNLYGWLVAIKLSRSYDVVLMRHMTFDPFSFFFAPFINNRVSVHHAKEIEELRLIRKGWKGNLASLVERFSGRFSGRNVKSILGVTNEIALYEKAVHQADVSTGVYPNGVEVKSIPLLSDMRKDDEINIVFICGTFSPWHGLDRLVCALKEKPDPKNTPTVNVHLIGKLSQDQLEQVGSVESSKISVFQHGVMELKDYRNIMAGCDFGIGSLAMDRQNLTEGSTLKVREMLALGLPVYSGHKDLALPHAAAWAKVVDSVSLTDLVEFGLSVKSIRRSTVRNESSALIEKSEVMRRAIEGLRY